MRPAEGSLRECRAFECAARPATWFPSDRYRNCARRPRPSCTQMAHTGLFCRLRKVLSLLHLAYCADRPEILNAEYSVHASCSLLGRAGILEIALHHLD